MPGIMKSERGPSIRLPSGEHFFPFDPRPDEIDLVDIAHILCQTRRWNGACKRFYSVAEHSMLVADAVPPEHRLQALLHDAPEALTGFGDVPTPIKRMTSFVTDMENRIWQVICEKFDLPYEMHTSVKWADKAIAALEVRDLTDWADKPEVHDSIRGMRADGMAPVIAGRDFLISVNNELAARENLRAAQ